MKLSPTARCAALGVAAVITLALLFRSREQPLTPRQLASLETTFKARLAARRCDGDGCVIDFGEHAARGASLAAEQRNGALLNLSLAALRPGDTLKIPNRTFYVMGGIVATKLLNVTVRVDGTLAFSRRRSYWPRDAGGSVLPCLYFDGPSDVVFTSSGVGTLDGQGAAWWGIPGIGYLVRGEDRPRLFHAAGSPKDVLVEKLRFVNSPYWTFYVDGVDGLEVRGCHIDARRRASATTHSPYELTAFNTDGYDVTGRNVYIHDSSVWCQDDGIAVKDGSEDMLFERMDVSGVGITIGSIGASNVRNITFRDIRSSNPFKGIYLKFRSDGGNITDVTYENIALEAPEQWPIWIGPAQQSDSSRLCAAHPCSLCWPTDPWATCDAPDSQYKNILLKNVSIDSPRESLGVIIGSATSPMINVTFQDVVATNMNPDGAWGAAQYYCKGVASGRATGRTNVVPPCFEDATDARLR